MTRKYISDKIAEAIMDSDITDQIIVVLLEEALDSIFLNIESTLNNAGSYVFHEEIKVDFKYDVKNAKAILKVIEYCSRDFSKIEYYEKIKGYKEKYKKLVKKGGSPT